MKATMGKSAPKARKTLSSKTVDRLEEWIVQLERIYPGLRLHKSDLIDWIILRKRSTLSSTDLKSFQNHFSQQIEFAEWALQDRKSAEYRME